MTAHIPYHESVRPPTWLCPEHGLVGLPHACKLAALDALEHAVGPIDPGTLNWADLHGEISALREGITGLGAVGQVMAQQLDKASALLHEAGEFVLCVRDGCEPLPMQSTASDLAARIENFFAEAHRIEFDS